MNSRGTSSPAGSPGSVQQRGIFTSTPYHKAQVNLKRSLIGDDDDDEDYNDYEEYNGGGGELPNVSISPKPTKIRKTESPNHERILVPSSETDPDDFIVRDPGLSRITG